MRGFESTHFASLDLDFYLFTEFSYWTYGLSITAWIYIYTIKIMQIYANAGKP